MHHSARAKSGTNRRDLILDTALQLLNDGGRSSLTMRSLARSGNISVTTLYATVGDKGEIVQEVMNRLLKGLLIPTVPAIDARQELLRYFDEVRSVFDNNPVARELVGLEPIYGDAAFAGLDHIVGLLKQIGLDPDQASSACHTLVSYTIGFSIYTLRRSSEDVAAARLERVDNRPGPATRNRDELRLLIDPEHLRATYRAGIGAILQGFGHLPEREPG